MKKLMIVLPLLVNIVYFSISPVNAVEIEDKNLMLAVEELVKVKMIERELIFGLPLEDVALLNNLNKGRDIEFVVEHFEKYYCDDVLKQYLYYLKRSTSQELYLSLGVFWGSEYAVVGNSFKRNAEEVKYHIDYQSIEERKGITKVIVEVTPTYYGNYDVRGEKESEFIDSKRMVTLFLSKDNETYRLTRLDKATIDEMVNEIGEPIDLNQEKGMPVYDKLKEFEYTSEKEKAGLYFTYDILSRLIEGGHDKLYDRYENLWLTPEYKDYEGMLKQINLKNLRCDYLGWDYAYFYEHEDFRYKSADGTKKSDPYQKIDILLFMVEGSEVKKITMMETLTEVDFVLQAKIEALMKPFIPLMNSEVEIFMGDPFGDNNTLQELQSKLDESVIYGYYEWIRYFLDGIVEQGIRLSDSAPTKSLIIDRDTDIYKFNLPKGIPEENVYSDSKITLINKVFVPTVSVEEDKNLYPYKELISFSISRKFDFKTINFIMHDSIGIIIQNSTKLDSESNWSVDYGYYRIKRILNYHN